MLNALEKIKKDIEIPDYHLLSTFNSKQIKDFSYAVIFVSSDLVLNYDNEYYVLNKDDTLISDALYQCKVVSGEGIIVYIKGTLADKYITQELLDRILHFDKLERINKALNTIYSSLLDETKLNETTRIRLGMDILLDLSLYQDKYAHKYNRIVSNSLTIINEDYSEIFGVEDLSVRIGVNKSYLIRVFKDALDVTPGKYIEETKVEKSKQFLSSGNLSLDMVAKLCGYSNANYYSKVFKKVVGISPSEYRKTNPSILDLPPEFYL